MTGSKTVSAVLLVAGSAAWILSLALIRVSWARTAAADIRETSTGILVLAMAGGGILAWYPLFPNHTMIHAWVMVRMLALPIAYGFAALTLSIMQWREARMPQARVA